MPVRDLPAIREVRTIPAKPRGGTGYKDGGGWSMGRTIRLLLVGGVIAACMAVTGSAWASPKTVCAKGCAFTGIQAAINAASPGATITIAAGTYAENLVVDKSLTLQGAGRHTTIEPATSNPACAGGSLCGGTASNIVLVEASGVTVTAPE